ncbi:hypothetical protein J7E78_21205 [Paenibacillus polymyxa]|nr:hypothetical protein [Paenibacillus polymyxa]
MGAAVLVTLLWSTSYILNKIAFQHHIGPFTLAGLRYSVSALTLVLVRLILNIAPKKHVQKKEVRIQLRPYYIIVLGFPVPTRIWLKNEWYDWAKNLISTSRVEQWINKIYVLQLLDIHKEGKVDVSRKLWTILVFMMWHQVHIEGATASHEYKTLVI